MAGKKKELCNLTPGKKWGGSRPRSRRRSWKSGKTKTIRIPEALAETILDIAEKIDRGESGNIPAKVIRQRLWNAENKLKLIEEYLDCLEQQQSNTRTNGHSIRIAQKDNPQIYLQKLVEVWESRKSEE